MNTDFPTLLQELFHGNSRQLRVLLQPLTTEQRRALFSEFKELLKVLKRACRFQADAKTVIYGESIPFTAILLTDDQGGGSDAAAGSSKSSPSPARKSSPATFWPVSTRPSLVRANWPI